MSPAERLQAAKNEYLDAGLPLEDFDLNPYLLGCEPKGRFIRWARRKGTPTPNDFFDV